jgi:hypothetical protein
MTPKSGFLDPNWGRTKPIFPGMVLTKTVGNNYTLIGSAPTTTAKTQQPAGFAGQFIGGYGIDELLDAGINALAVWVMSPTGEAEFLAPAFASTQTWTDVGHGVDSLVYACVAKTGTYSAIQGQLVPAAFKAAHATTCSVTPVGRLVQIESTTAIIVGGLAVRAGTAG